jgi:hypothetical protein
MANQNASPQFKYVDSENMLMVYTNHTGISLTNFDVRIMFGQIEVKMGQAQAITGLVQDVTVINQGAVIMSPLHAKLFCENLKQNIEKFEKLFGEIKTPSQLLPAPAKG